MLPSEVANRRLHGPRKLTKSNVEIEHEQKQTEGTEKTLLHELTRMSEGAGIKQKAETELQDHGQRESKKQK